MTAKSFKVARFILPMCLGLWLTACGSDDAPKTSPPAANDQSVSTATSKTDVTQSDSANTMTKTESDIQSETTESALPTDAAQDNPVVAEASTEVGKARYEKSCKVCHDAGLLDAPKLTAKAEWQKRLSDKGLETLQIHSAKGFNKMPAQAVGEVTEAEVYAAVRYILDQAQ